MQQQNVYSIPTHQNQLLTGIVEELNQSLQFTNQSQHIRVNTPIQLFNLTSQFTPEGTDQSNHPKFQHAQELNQLLQLTNPNQFS